jgi:hypothetical protein
LLGWLWVDSTTAVHNIMDRQSHANHRELDRICSCIGLDSFYLITVALHKAMRGKILWLDCYVCRAEAWLTPIKSYKRGNSCRNRLTKNLKRVCPNWKRKWTPGSVAVT